VSLYIKILEGLEQKLGGGLEPLSPIAGAALKFYVNDAERETEMIPTESRYGDETDASKRSSETVTSFETETNARPTTLHRRALNLS